MIFYLSRLSLKAFWIILMNKRTAAVLAIIVIILIVAAVTMFVWVKQKNPQTVQEADKAGETGKERFSGTECYGKDPDGSDNFYKLSDDFNLDEPTAKITYLNQAKGISVEILYNPNWGNKNCKVEVYLEFVDELSGDVFLEFGKPRAWIRSEFGLSISDRRTAEAIINEQSTGYEPNPNPREMVIGGKQIVAYESYGMITERVYEVIGSKYNYSFTYSEIDQINEDIAKELERIIEGAKID